ncbi:DUF2147 domain-containing protein [Bradyrhizobium sp. WBOS7]|uniref:DUF2147 domain-containing protein n=2 Tax=Nitrobacteraceae TaxID=41294 RepID=A0AAE9NB98_9BRAD|nr:DUF2147 domain-containing protein [Bradyrhizobium sp. WBOS2]MDD1569467.1 DUF2147 domain-containing protein [Bradyrhizobium sp. WBOS1]MDD1575566.1 DUF2147 domain-containing protein [Bradyrhizobium sp. WBOS7]MDD1604250.1 DUF2147 domain-containing protein [Bradyrhizobium sp. WBOS16]UUO36025.1 DUF2147 domain-containing protein [Bradyrhizobium sp. WBOS01]UUO42331.1 DUF2147 domain-containing protein [Bradyrhizobium sp. WBOS02]UUO56670.1 DUF2147 domain-containing protein [Bradyrhizobium sp. WBOS0
MLHCRGTTMRLALYTGLILAGGYTCLTPALAADPTGDWRVADGVANIRVAQCNGSMWGAVAWEKKPGGRDENNPDVSKKNRPTLGMVTLIDMKKKAGADQWEGQVYNAQDGQIYSATITPVGTDQLEIKGCVMGFLCGGETWTRVGPPIPSSTANAMAKGAPKPTGAAPKAAGTTVAAAPAPAAPKPAGAAKPGQKSATDPVGDICLLPEIAGFAH